MQFSVPQFTDVEDKIIGSLTLKQFGIVFGAGIVVFTAFSATKSVVVTVFVGILVGLPALGMAFVKLNGRPMYNMMGFFLGFIISPKVLVFHKLGTLISDSNQQNNKEKPQSEQEKQEQEGIDLRNQIEAVDPRQRIREVNKILEQKAREEKELFDK